MHTKPVILLRFSLSIPYKASLFPPVSSISFAFPQIPTVLRFLLHMQSPSAVLLFSGKYDHHFYRPILLIPFASYPALYEESFGVPNASEKEVIFHNMPLLSTVYTDFPDTLS